MAFELSNNFECTAPPRFGEEINDDITELLYPVRHACLQVLVSRCFERPVDDKGFAQNIVSRDESPVPAVLAVIPVVAHRKVLIRRDLVWPEMFVDASRINILRIVFLQRLPIDIDRAAHHFDSIAGHADQSFYVCNLRAVRVFEYDDISAFRAFIGKNLRQDPGMKAINEFVDKKMVADQQVGFHGSGWDLECLNDKGSGKERNDGGNNDGFKILSNRRFAKFQLTLLQFHKFLKIKKFSIAFQFTQPYREAPGCRSILHGIWEVLGARYGTYEPEAEWRRKMEKVALITGSTSNIGKAIAEALARQGFHPVITSRNEEEARAIAENLSCSYFRADFSDVTAIESLFKFIKEKLNRLDVLVNNVAYTKNESISDCDLKTWEYTINTNLRSYYLCTRLASEMMKEQGGGCIINITVSSLRGMKDKFSYIVSKGGVNSLTMCAAMDLAPFNIRVNAVGSGLVGTPVGYRDFVNRPYENSRIPMGHIGKPEDVAEAAAFLVSEKAKYITGAILSVDGGVNAAL